MANTIKIKRSAVAGKTPAVGDLQLGELAINTYDGKLYTKKSVSGTESVVEIGAGGGGGGTSGPILQPAYLISENVTFAANCHGLSLTSVEVASGYSVEVPNGATWTIAVL
jgi:hypothetical protein